MANLIGTSYAKVTGQHLLVTPENPDEFRDGGRMDKIPIWNAVICEAIEYTMY